MIGDPSVDFNVVSFDVDMKMSSVILGITGSSSTGKSILAYSHYSSESFSWAQEYSLPGNALLAEVRFGDLDGVKPYDGSIITALTTTYPRYLILLESSSGDSKYF